MLATTLPALTTLTAQLPVEIPSPTTGVWYLGPFPVRAYAMCILAGIVVAVWLTQRRLETRGGRAGQVLDISAWAVPFGIIGGRIYHLITSPQAPVAYSRSDRGFLQQPELWLTKPNESHF